MVIVVGTDGSAAANETVRHGAALARTVGGTLHIVSAYRRLERYQRQYSARTIPTNLDVDCPGDPERQARAIVEDAAHEVKHRAIKIKLHTVVGEPADAICDVASRVDATLIVVGNRGARNPFRRIYHPIFKRVQNDAPCDVHVVDTEHHRRRTAGS